MFPELIDTHAHLNFSPFADQPEPFLERAAEKGVRAVIVPAVDLASSETALRLADKYEMIYAAVGVHPEEAGNEPEGYLKEIEMMCAGSKTVAIGEIGMDFYRDYSLPEDQMRIFSAQTELAKSMNMPVIIHSRRAEDSVLEILDHVDWFSGQCHCFTGSEVQARNFLSRGLLLSFTGVITFAKDVRETASKLPVERLMIETDSPFMAPKPYRGKTCEPSYVLRVAETYAEIFGEPIARIAEITTENALELFSGIRL